MCQECHLRVRKITWVSERPVVCQECQLCVRTACCVSGMPTVKRASCVSGRPDVSQEGQFGNYVGLLFSIQLRVCVK